MALAVTANLRNVNQTDMWAYAFEG